jgi:mannose-6-phosphate isomerase
MNRISVMKNTVQEYAWGSYTAIAELLGTASPAKTPQAELWMGAHPKAPSMVICDGNWISLLELIKKNPNHILGKKVAENFDNRLPYLFKVLAAAKPLSIQAHPAIDQAKQGFERENRQGIPIDAYNRNYKDDNHKPECICAHTLFWGLNGFRKISSIVGLMEKICPQGLKKQLDTLRDQQSPVELKIFFQTLMTMNHKQRTRIIAHAVSNAKKIADDNPAYKWMIDLHKEYPSDIGVFSPILLNLICLEPGQAMFLPAGELHAYLDGVGIELMANSDNVLRGGLTSKYIDMPELLNVLNFEEREVNILETKQINECEWVYETHAEEFILSVIHVKEGIIYTSPVHRSIEILLCTDGKAMITDIGKSHELAIAKGTSILIPAGVTKYSLKGNATLYKAAVPLCDAFVKSPTSALCCIPQLFNVR